MYNQIATNTCRCKLISYIIAKNIRYLLRNRYVWRTLNNTYHTFQTSCIRCTKHLCDSFSLTDIHSHFIPSPFPIISKTAVYLLWRHRYMNRSLAIVTRYDRLFPRGSMDAFLSQWRWGLFKDFVKYTSVTSFSSFISERMCGAVDCLASDVIINWLKGNVCLICLLTFPFYFRNPMFQHGALLVSSNSER